MTAAKGLLVVVRGEDDGEELVEEAGEELKIRDGERLLLLLRPGMAMGDEAVAGLMATGRSSNCWRG